MTIPATTDFFAVQNVFQMRSGLPEDVIVNTFIFRNNNVAGAQLDHTPQQRAADVVRNFFTVAAPALPNLTPAPGNLLSLMSGIVNGWQQKVYDLGRPPGGRVPQVFDRTAELVGLSTGQALPPELSVVLSLQTNVIGRRGKGRLFLGPFSTNALAAAADQLPIVNAALKNRILAQAQGLLINNNGDVGWAVWSPTRQKMADVIGGTVDNAWDIQRRRGNKPTARDRFGSTVPSVTP